MATPADPIAPVVTALNAIATATHTDSGTEATDWKNGNATPSSVASVVAILIQALYKASPDMKSVGTDIENALTEVSNVVGAIADQFVTLAGEGTDITSALTGVQNGLALAQTLAPTSATTVLSSGSQLFQQLQQLLAATDDLNTAATELYQLNQQFVYMSTHLF